jgi:formylglycine-generating enzyme required for sulfatase activity
MVRISAGKFLSGRMQEETMLEYDFFMDEAPVTNQDFLRFTAGLQRLGIDHAIQRGE